MDKEFLSVCIPTRNRSVWLGKALSRLAGEIETAHIGPDTVTIYVVDNCSEDVTPYVVESFQYHLPHLQYSRHQRNIGGNANVLHCHSLGQGEYHWVMGDDDAICAGQLAYILDCLRTHRPALFINHCGGYQYGFETPALFGNYREFAEACMRINPHALIAHSLITSNIFRSACFNCKTGVDKIKTSYGQMYGMVDGMTDSVGGVFVTDRQTIDVSESALNPVDGLWPPDMFKLWEDYLDWTAARFNLTDIKGADVQKYMRRAVLLEIKAHPFETAWRYGKKLSKQQTWRTLRRLFKNL